MHTTIDTLENTNNCSEDFLQLIDILARQVHEQWMHGRLEEVWTWGPVRNDQLHQHPNLVPYDDLAENDKDYDRNTALATIRTLHTLGYRIEKAHPTQE